MNFEKNDYVYGSYLKRHECFAFVNFKKSFSFLLSY